MRNYALLTLWITILVILYVLMIYINNPTVDLDRELYILDALKNNKNNNKNNNNNNKATETFTSVSSIQNNIDKVGNGIPCAWHYDKETGKAAGYFSDVINDPVWQMENPDTYKELSKLICPEYLETCTGQRADGIVEGRCITVSSDCNNKIFDRIADIEDPDFEASPEDTEESVPSTLIEKNNMNMSNLRFGVETLNAIIHEPGGEDYVTLETFANNGNDNNDSNTDKCKYKIENKCYEQYVDADKLYYDNGAKIFESVFPKAENNLFAKACNSATKWFSDNLTWILAYKFFAGIAAFALYYSVDTRNPPAIKIFKGFIAFLFCEIYLLFCLYKYILKPFVNKDRPVYVNQ